MTIITPKLTTYFYIKSQADPYRPFNQSLSGLSGLPSDPICYNVFAKKACDQITSLRFPLRHRHPSQESPILSLLLLKALRGYTAPSSEQRDFKERGYPAHCCNDGIFIQGQTGLQPAL